jgi:hypothetical protein
MCIPFAGFASPFFPEAWLMITILFLQPVPCENDLKYGRPEIV